MFILNLYDRIGNKLNLGDIVKISDGKDFNFYSEVKYLNDEKIIVPFYTFSFHSFEKVESVPNEAIRSTEERYNIWYMKNPEKDLKANEFEHYLCEWRSCERLLDKRIFRIEPIEQKQLTLF